MAAATANVHFGGSGGTSTLRDDPQGKSYAAMLPTVPVEVPADWVLDAMLSARKSLA